MNRINIAICDDRNLIKIIEDLIENISETIRFDFDIQRFDSPEKLYHALIREKKEFDVFFVSLNVDHTIGIDIGTAIRQELQNYDAPLFYVSPYVHFYERFFELQPYYFIKTPIIQSDFARKFSTAISRLQNKNNLYSFQKNKSTIWVKQKNIVFLESKSRYLIINFLKDGELVSVKYIGALKNECPKFNPAFFIRPHSSFIVNLDYVVEYDGTGLKMINDLMIPISKNRNDHTKKCLSSFYAANSSFYMSM